MKNIIKENENSVEAGVIQIDDKKYNLSNYNNNISKNSLKKLYEDLYQECKYRDKLLIKKEKDKEKYTTENGVLKVANETLISNLKLHMKKLEQENAQKRRWNGKGYDTENNIVFELNNGNGYVKDFYNNGYLRFEGNYEKGLKNGEGKEYDS